MLEQFRKIYQLLDAHERLRGIGLMALVLILGLVEVLGIASIMPFMAVVADPSVIETNAYLNHLYIAVGFTEHNQFLVFLGVVVFIILVSTLLFSAMANWAIFRFSQMCNYRLSSRLLTNYLHRPYVWFLRQHSADLGKTVLSEVTQVVNSVILPSIKLISRLVAAFFLMALIVIIDPIVAAVAALVIGGSYLTIFMAVQRYLVKIGTDMYEANAQRFKIAQDSLGGIKDVKVAGLESTYAERYVEHARRFAQRQASQWIVADIPRYMLEAIAFGGMLAALIMLMITRPGGLGEVLPLIALYAFAGYRLLPAVQQVYVNAALVKFGSRVLDRLHVELSHPTDEISHRDADMGGGAALTLNKELDLRGISFSYPEAQGPMLDNVSISIKANSTVGFVGTTGAGKTTLIDIVLGLLVPDKGQLLVDGVEINDKIRSRWQRVIGYVPQSIFLIDDTVAANIAFGVSQDNVDMHAVEAAARAAHLHSFIVEEMPDGYATMIGERGVRLSGGQRQRIGIARALYHDPSVLVMDEATSALDNVTEAQVMRSIKELGRRKTVLMIAHRLSTVRQCDRIFLLDRGRVVAEGAFEQLVDDNEIFRAMAEGDAEEQPSLAAGL
jgi:ATP-binding cassette, subfamily B, bacterial PglK